MKMILVLLLIALTSCSEVERAKFFGTYDKWYVGLEKGVAADVNFQYNWRLVDSRKIKCDYYIELEDGEQLKYSRYNHDKELTCKYNTGDEVNVEVYEDTFGNREYILVGID